MFVCSLLLCVGYAFAEENIEYKQIPVKIQVGDTVSIDREQTTYVTGEKISSWVYDVNHVVRQVDSKYHPGCVLVQGINSWVVPKALIPNGLTYERILAAFAQQMVDQNLEQQKQQQEPAPEVVEEPKEESTPEVVEEPKEEPAPEVIEEPKEEPAPEVAEEPKEEKKPQYDRFSIGVRGGVASLMQDLNGSERGVIGDWNYGWDARLDLQYAHYWLSKREHSVGLLTGISAGYNRSAVTTGVNDQYTVSPETSSQDIIYTIEAEQVKEVDGQIVVEVPLMFSLITKGGFFMNVGPRFSLPVYNHYKQEITNPNITATFVEYGVSVENRPVTGVLTENDKNTRGKWAQGQWMVNVMLSAELGYEWKLKNNNSLGFGAYADYSVYTYYLPMNNLPSIVDLGTEILGNGVPTVGISSVTDVYMDGVGFFDCGLKLTYHFNFMK